ncbi:hypothetical protein IPG41_03940 [Candidatus Peregrinibacteria bacterium]|nr:MAG: hypothetical protein IPG41_03940 [Candidatus Peregrinibacteria bacterium]
MIIAAARRKRINCMMDSDLLDRLGELIPPGERSDFVNEAVEEKLLRWGRQKAFEELEKFKAKHPLKMSNKQMLKMIHESRRY